MLELVSAPSLLPVQVRDHRVPHLQARKPSPDMGSVHPASPRKQPRLWARRPTQHSCLYPNLFIYLYATVRLSSWEIYIVLFCSVLYYKFTALQGKLVCTTFLQYVTSILTYMFSLDSAPGGVSIVLLISKVVWAALWKWHNMKFAREAMNGLLPVARGYWKPSKLPSRGYWITSWIILITDGFRATCLQYLWKMIEML